MFKVSCFADEISPDFQVQIDLCKKLGFNYIELRSAYDTNLLDLDDDKLAFIKSQLEKNCIKVSAIGSPIGKYYLEDDFLPHYKKFEHALDLAHYFDCKYVRIFSFYSKEDISTKSDEVVARLKKMVAKAEEKDIILVHENEEMIYGHPAKACLELAEKIDSKYFQLVIDPANYCLAGEAPFDYSYQVTKQFVNYIHAKDYSHESKSMVKVGLGDGQFDQLLPEFKNRDIFITLEPHLDVAGQYRGFSGPELFSEAYESLISCLKRNDLDFV